MFSRRCEATPVPVPGSKIRPSELRSLVYVERRVGILRPPPLVIDLTQDDEDEYRIPSRNHQLDMTSSFAALAIRSREPPNSPRLPHFGSSSNFQRRTSQKVPREAQATSSPPGSANRLSKKRKESESGEEGDEKKIWSAKRRLRPRKQVAYAENDVGDDMDLDEVLGNPLPSIEQDGDDESGSDSEEFDVERVIAQRTGPNGMHEYLLGWVGYTELNWIPAQNCNCAELIAQFHAVPQFDFLAQSQAGQQLIEQERIRWLDRYAGKRAETPARPVRTQGPLEARNPKTGRFERKRVDYHPPQMGKPIPQIRNPPPQIGQVIPDSADHGNENTGHDEEVDALMNAVHDLLRDVEDNEIHIPFPRLSPFNTLSRDSNPRQSKSPGHEQEDRFYDTISIRQTSVHEEISLPNAHAAQYHQRPRQTAKVYWERDTPGAEQEHTSFMDMRATDPDEPATTHLETGHISQDHSAEASRWIAVKSRPVQPFPTSPRHGSSYTAAIQKTHISALTSPATEPHTNSTSSWSAINARTATPSRLFPALSSSPSRGHRPRLTAAQALRTGNQFGGASTSLKNLPSLFQIQQPLIFNMGSQGQGDLQSPWVASAAGAKTNLQQAEPANLLKLSQGSVIESQAAHEFIPKNIWTSNATPRRRTKVVPKTPLVQSRVATNRSSTKPMRRKIITALQRGTDAIEAELANTTGPHDVSKKTVAAALSTASMNALKRPAFLQKQPPSTQTRQPVRSPSVATKAFLEAREQERREKEAPTLIRAEVNRDYGPYYPKGLSLIAQLLAAESRMSSTPANSCRIFPKTRHGFNFSDDTPRPSIEG